MRGREQINVQNATVRNAANALRNSAPNATVCRYVAMLVQPQKREPHVRLGHALAPRVTVPRRNHVVSRYSDATEGTYAPARSTPMFRHARHVVSPSLSRRERRHDSRRDNAKRHHAEQPRHAAAAAAQHMASVRLPSACYRMKAALRPPPATRTPVSIMSYAAKFVERQMRQPQQQAPYAATIHRSAPSARRLPAGTAEYVHEASMLV